jgi:hypothetical protein
LPKRAWRSSDDECSDANDLQKEGYIMKSEYGVFAFAIALAAACGGASANQGEAAGSQAYAGADHVARINPCALVTKEEIQRKVEASWRPSDLAWVKSHDVTWSISTDSVTHGESRNCLVKWQITANGEMRERGDFSVSVATGEWLKTLLADMKKPPLAIPGVGDEAYFTGGGERSPYARVGDLAIGIEASWGQPAVDLLRVAVSRVH